MEVTLDRGLMVLVVLVVLDLGVLLPQC